MITDTDLAQTYHPSNYVDPTDAIRDYHRVLEYKSHHPNKKSSAIGNRLDLPRGRVRTWLGGGKPDALHGIETSRKNNWIENNYGDPEFRGLNVLVACIFTTGSISRETYSPHFAIDDSRDTISIIERAADLANVDVAESRKAEAGRSRELRVSKHASVLGRVLTCLGAPIGVKNRQSRINVPSYLNQAPDLIRREFAQAYVLNRGHHRQDTGIIQFREERPESYRGELARFLQTVIGKPVTTGEHNVYLSKEAVRVINDWSEPLGEQTAVYASRSSSPRSR